MEHGTKDPRVRGYARMYGVPIAKLEGLESEILKAPCISVVDFDASALESKQLCVLAKYDIAPEVQNYWAMRSDVRQSVVKAANKCGLVRTGDPIEDYGEHFYYVFKAAAWFEKE